MNPIIELANSCGKEKNFALENRFQICLEIMQEYVCNQHVYDVWIQKVNLHGMQGTRLQKEIVKEFLQDPALMYAEAETIYKKYSRE